MSNGDPLPVVVLIMAGISGLQEIYTEEQNKRNR